MARTGIPALPGSGSDRKSALVAPVAPGVQSPYAGVVEVPPSAVGAARNRGRRAEALLELGPVVGVVHPRGGRAARAAGLMHARVVVARDLAVAVAVGAPLVHVVHHRRLRAALVLQTLLEVVKVSGLAGVDPVGVRDLVRSAEVGSGARVCAADLRVALGAGVADAVEALPREVLVLRLDTGGEGAQRQAAGDDGGCGRHARRAASVALVTPATSGAELGGSRKCSSFTQKAATSAHASDQPARLLQGEPALPSALAAASV